MSNLLYRIRLNRRMGLCRMFASLLLALSAAFMAVPASASPWVDVSETRIRQHLEFLNDAGVISIGVTTWPVMWIDISNAIASVNQLHLTSAQKSAVDELEFELRYQSANTVKRSVKLSVANSRAIFNDSSTDYIEKGSLKSAIDMDWSRVSMRLQGNVTTDPGNDKTDSHLDGSYLMGSLGNWVLGVGAIDRWWGPSSNTSLILSSNARPIPAAIFRTRGEQTFESRWLSWIGPWQFVTFVGRMESKRAIPEAHLTGMRLTIRPVEGLEMGASRAMQWGGIGRDKNFNAFFKSFTSQDENTKQGSGNQLGGFDLRYSFGLVDGVTAAFYSQLIGEDEAGYMPSKYMSQFGLESTWALPDSASYIKGFVEYVDSTAGSLNDPQYNAAYEHSTYQTGYRYRRRPIAASFDGDSRVLSVGATWNMLDSRSLGFTVNKLDLNRDGDPGGHTVSTDKQALYQLKMRYQCLLWGGRFSVGYSYFTEEFLTPQLDVERRAAFGAWEYRF